MKIDPKGLAAFVAVIELGNFDKAAQQLCVTQSAISQRIKLLEEKLGKSLLIRTTPPQATKAGMAVLKYAQQLTQLERHLAETLTPKRDKEWLTINLAVNADSLATWLLSALAEWCKTEKVLIHFHIDDQDETHHLLQSGEVIGCVSANEQAAYGCRCNYLGTMTYHCMVSPDFYTTYFKKGVNQTTIAQAPMVRFNDKDLLQHQYLKTYFSLDADHQPQHRLSSSEGYMDWIRLGLGFGMLPTIQAKTWQERGELIPLTPNKPIYVPLYWHEWGGVTALSQSLRDTIQQAAQKLSG